MPSPNNVKIGLCTSPETWGTVISTFAGNNGYYGSNAEAAFAVDPVAATPTPQPTQVSSMADQYFLPMSIAIIIAIIVVGVIIVLTLRKQP